MESSSKRLAKNTTFLYFRTILLLVIGVYTSRITLEALGVDNYGIINVVSGFVGMFSIISASLTGACQRFITYEIGKENGDIRMIFTSSLLLHIILGLILIIFAETIGLYIVDNVLNLPKDSDSSIMWVYQCSVFSLVVSLLNIPYNSIIIAHEKLKVFAYISLLEGILKFALALVILYCKSNTLILYAILTLVSSIIIQLTFQFYCRTRFAESVKPQNHIDKTVIKQIFGFAGWTFLGNSATICSNQGVNVVLNIFCGVVVNAARGIAVMVESVIVSFINNFTTALDPQITKAYAQHDTDQLISLLSIGMKITFSLMLVMALPIIISADGILHIWFVDVPMYTTIFVQLTLVIAFIQAIGKPFLTLLLATGKIRNYQLFSGTVTFLNLPISYILLKLGLSPTYVYITGIMVMATVFLGRFWFVKHLTSLKLSPYFRQLLRQIIIIMISFGILFILHVFISPITNLWRLILFGIISTAFNFTILYSLGLSATEKRYVRDFLHTKLCKII